MIIWMGLLVWLCYLVGQFLYGFSRAQLIVHSTLNGVASYRAFLVLHSGALLFRFGIATGIFCIWGYDQEFMTQLVHAGGYIVGNDFLKTTTLMIPFNPVSSFFFGIFADVGLDQVAARIPGLGKEIPRVYGAYSDKP